MQLIRKAFFVLVYTTSFGVGGGAAGRRVGRKSELRCERVRSPMHNCAMHKDLVCVGNLDLLHCGVAGGEEVVFRLNFLFKRSISLYS